MNSKFFREYFEKGCLCILNGKLRVMSTETDEEAVERYCEQCECSRHPEPKE